MAWENPIRGIDECHDIVQTTLSSGKDGNRTRLFLHLPDRIHKVVLCIK
jgi:hypothetical protein